MQLSAGQPQDVHQVPSGTVSTILRETKDILWCAADSYTKRQLLYAIVLVVASAFIVAVTPVGLKYVVDSLTGVTHGAVRLTPLGVISLYVLGQYLWRCSTELRLMVHGYAEQRLRRRISGRLFAHVVRLPLRFHLDRKAGALGETAEQGIRGYQLLMQHLVYNILPVVVELGVVTAVLLSMQQNKYLVILSLTAIAYAITFYRGARTIRDSAEGVSTSHIEAHGLMTDSLLNQETVKYFDAEPIVCARYDTALARTESAWRSFLRRRATNGLAVATIFAVSLGASLIYAATDVARGAMTAGDFVLVNAYIVRLVQPLEMVGYAIRDIVQGVAFLGGMLSIFREKTEADRQSLACHRPLSSGELAFIDVTFGYGRQRIVLKKITFTVPAGKTVAVVGVSGSGKSSLIRLLFRLYEPDSGTILLDGVPISDTPLSTVRRAIAVVPQDTVLFHDTVAANIGFGRLGASRHEIEEAARIANLHDFIMGLPEQYETVVGERGLKLSGGERQRVAIARAALKRPRIAVFDEATSSLDSRTEREILRNLATLSSQCTTLVIAHRLSTVVHADEILVLNQGSIVERGTHEELLALSGHYAALWIAQQSGAHGRGEAHASVA